MPRCPHCGHFLTGHPVACPACSLPVGESEDFFSREGIDEDVFADRPRLAESDRQENDFSEGEAPLTPIARFRNAAEAGYFAHELMQSRGIQVAVNMDESFDALGGYWSTRFLLCVPQSCSESAAHALQQLVEQTEVDDLIEAEEGPPPPTVPAEHRAEHQAEHRYGATDFDGDAALEEGVLEESGVNWVPIVLTLAAGSAVLWGVRTFHERPKREVPAARIGGQHHDLWESLSISSKPWIQQHENGRGRRELIIDPERETATIREDVNGDGNYEREFRVRRAAERQ